MAEKKEEVAHIDKEIVETVTTKLANLNKKILNKFEGEDLTKLIENSNIVMKMTE